MKRYVAIIVTAVAGAYLAAALTLTSYMAAADTCTEVCIQVNDTSSHPFVTVRELNRDLGDIMNHAPGRPLSEVNTYEIEQRLAGIDKIEDAKALVLTSGKVLIEVTPMRPVARIFEGNKSRFFTRVFTTASATGISSIITLYTEFFTSLFEKPRPLVAFPCGSRSTIRHLYPLSARYAERFTQVVVLPTPPF